MDFLILNTWPDIIVTVLNFQIMAGWEDGVRVLPQCPAVDGRLPERHAAFLSMETICIVM